jgi:hypothetical protein
MCSNKKLQISDLKVKSVLKWMKHTKTNTKFTINKILQSYVLLGLSSFKTNTKSQLSFLRIFSTWFGFIVIRNIYK